LLGNSLEKVWEFLWKFSKILSGKVEENSDRIFGKFSRKSLGISLEILWEFSQKSLGKSLENFSGENLARPASKKMVRTRSL